MIKKIAIIGSGSFIASYIIDILKSDFELYLFGREKVADYNFEIFIYPDKLLDHSKLLEFEAIIFTAGAGIQNSLNESNDNVFYLNTFIPIQIINFLIANNYKGKFISFGSYFEIGDVEKAQFFNEEQVANSMNMVSNNYCISKRLLTRYLNSLNKQILFYHFILPNIYGPGENSKRLIPYIINACENNKEIKLTSGFQVRQYLHAADVANFVREFLKYNKPSGIYNLTNPIPIQVKELVEFVFMLLNKKERFSSDIFGKSHRSDTAMPYLLLSNEKVSRISTLRPRISLDQGIKSYLK